MRVAHISDTHFSMKPEKLAEVMTVTDAALEKMAAAQPDLIVISGDTVDEFDGPIHAKSDCYRAAYSFVERCAEIAPVAIVLGTPSHDRDMPINFRKIPGVYVADKIEMVALRAHPFKKYEFMPLDSVDDNDLAAVLTFLPSPDKSKVIAAFGGESKQMTNLVAKEVLHDALAYIGEVNASVPAGIPKIVIGHGMITGAMFSTGAVSTGEDFEFRLHDLIMTNTDLKCFGHVHKHQIFPGNIVYAGSPGRLNFGEVEDKGFVMAEIDYFGQVSLEFIKLPAREFFLCECEWEGIEQLLADVDRFSVEVKGCDVRFRYTIPEEERHKVNRADIEATFLNGGARMVKIECVIVPKLRARAEGISRLVTLREKIIKWAGCVNIDVPERVLTISDTIEGKTVPELLEKPAEPEYGIVVGK